MMVVTPHNSLHQQLPLTNQQVALLLDEVAELLDAQNANPFRVRAYRTAGETLRQADRQAWEILKDEGASGLMRFHGIGHSLAKSIEQLALTGELAMLNRLRGDATPERLFASVSGIGPHLARRIHEQLDIESLAELEAAAHDGRLASVEGMGSGRIRGVRESLAGRFRQRPHAPQSHSQQPPSQQPTVSELLEIDEEYRRKATADRLFRIAPKRFNPTKAAWLPILHTRRGDRHYTALYSNTVRAHELGMTNDWVVIYRDDGDGHGQWTVVTAHYGDLKSKRIVRGCEEECADHYARLQTESR
jgi:hypothetical protein